MAKTTSTPARQPEDSSEEPLISPSRRLSWFWFLPVVAAMLGLWLTKQHFDHLGDLVKVSLPSAEGLAVNKTEVRCRAVRVGILESITLTDNLEVNLGLRITPEYLHLLREDSQFWVVKARISGGSISGLGTVLSGAYLELDPGTGRPGKRKFEGLENPPPTPNSVPGLRLELLADEVQSLDVGSGVFFKNNLVGQVESRAFDPVEQKVRFDIFIEERYRNLIGTNTLFWGDSGFQVRVGPDGVEVALPSLDALLRGRITFGVTEEDSVGEEVVDGYTFNLFPSEKEALASAFQAEGRFLLLFEQSVRGLSEGAAVEFRGLRVGRVSKISYALVKNATETQTPVLVELNKRLLAEHFPPELLDAGGKGIAMALEGGLRASLKSSNLLTGQRYVDLDYYPLLEKGEVVMSGKYLVLPTITTGLGQLEEGVTAAVEKINALPIEGLLNQLEATTLAAQNTLHVLNEKLESTGPVLAESQATMAEMKASLASLNQLLAAETTQSIPQDVRETLASINSTLKPLSAEGAVYGDMRRTLDELRSTTRSIERLTKTLADKPNSVIFGKPAASDQIPRAKR